RAAHGQVERLVLRLHDALGGDRGADREDDRCEQHAEEECGKNYALVADVLQHFLAKDDSDAAHSTRSPSAARTKASSKSAAPVCSRMKSGVPLTTTRPPEMMTMSSRSAATSCMTWLENRMHRPLARSSRSSSRSMRTAFTSSPLVGSSRMMVCGRCMSARPRATLRRSPCE